MQHLLIIVLFILAVSYLARLIYQHFQPYQGCGSCSAVDLEKAKSQISKEV